MTFKVLIYKFSSKTEQVFVNTSQKNLPVLFPIPLLIEFSGNNYANYRKSLEQVSSKSQNIEKPQKKNGFRSVLEGRLPNNVIIRV